MIVKSPDRPQTLQNHHRLMNNHYYTRNQRILEHKERVYPC